MADKKHEETFEEQFKRFKELESNHNAQCPSCGYCRHCGRGGAWVQPYYPYPYYPHPHPYWPTITWTTSGGTLDPHANATISYMSATGGNLTNG